MVIERQPLADAEPAWLAAHIPDALREPTLGLQRWQWLGLLVTALAGYLIGRFLSFVLVRLAARVTKHTKVTWDDGAFDALRAPTGIFFALLSVDSAVDSLALPPRAMLVEARVMGTSLIVVSAWIAIRLVGVVATFLERRAESRADESGGVNARAIATQVRVLRRVVNVTLGIIALALVLTQFEIVRSVGVSLLASAGLAGVVIGFAAQRTFSSLIAGIQLSATQPIRIGDVVVVEKEWGTIEEITLTYVVVKVWDERRLIVPMSRFLEQPFENWTKVSSEIHGAVLLHTDWLLPVDALRAEATRLVEGHPDWDGRTKSVQVTGTTDRTLEVRVLVSASDASKLWKLRVDLREQLVRWLQEYEGGRFVPHGRVAGPDGASRDRAAAVAMP